MKATIKVSMSEVRSRIWKSMESTWDMIQSDYWEDIQGAVKDGNIGEVKTFTTMLEDSLKSQQQFHHRLNAAKTINQVVMLCMEEDYAGFFIGEYSEVFACIFGVDLQWDEEIITD